LTDYEQKMMIDQYVDHYTQRFPSKASPVIYCVTSTENYLKLF